MQNKKNSSQNACKHIRKETMAEFKNNDCDDFILEKILKIHFCA